MSAPPPAGNSAPPSPAAVPSLTLRRATLPVTILIQSAATAAVVGPAVAAPRLLERLQLPAAALGVFVALVYLGAMFSSQLGALWVRRWGPIRASQVALLSGAVGLALLAVPSRWAAALAAPLIGLGYGPITPASSQLLARTTDPKNFSLVFSIKQTGVPLGGVIAGLMVPPLVLWQGGAAATLGLAALSLIAAASALPLAGALDTERDASARWPGLLKLMAPMRLVWSHPHLRSLALCSLVFSAVQLSLTSYAVSWLHGELAWTLLAAGAALSASQVAGVVGRIVWGWVADRWLGARPMLIALSLAMLLCSLAMLLVNAGSSTPLVLTLLCLYGATAVGWNGVYLATVARLVSKPQAAEATAGTLFFTFFGVVIGPPLFGAAGAALGGLSFAFACLALPLTWGTWSLWRARWS